MRAGKVPETAPRDWPVSLYPRCVFTPTGREEVHSKDAVTPEMPVRPVRCPGCQGFDVRRSYPDGVLDGIMIHFGRPPLRCRRCSYRFYLKLGPQDRLGLPDSPSQPVDWGF